MKCTGVLCSVEYFPFSRPTREFHLLAKLLVFVHVLARRNADKHKPNALAVLARLEEQVDRIEPTEDPLGVIHPLDGKDEPLSLVRFAMASRSLANSGDPACDRTCAALIPIG